MESLAKCLLGTWDVLYELAKRQGVWSGERQRSHGLCARRKITRGTNIDKINVCTQLVKDLHHFPVSLFSLISLNFFLFVFRSTKFFTPAFRGIRYGLVIVSLEAREKC